MSQNLSQRLRIRERLNPPRTAAGHADLVATVARSLAAGLLFAGAALVCHRAGVLEQWPPYAVMGATAVPQLVTALVALIVRVARPRVRIARVGVEYGFAAIALVLVAMTVFSGAAHGWDAPVTVAAGLASLACLVSAAPPRVELARRSR